MKPICSFCGIEGHKAAECPSGGQPQVQFMGHAISGEGFFCIELPEDESEEEDEDNGIIISFMEAPLSCAHLEAELQELFECDWD